MAKFKVGDKVRTSIKLADENEEGRFGITDSKDWNDEKIQTITCVNNATSESISYRLDGSSYSFPEYALINADPRREFIVIHRDGSVMTAEHRVNREVIKSAKATCSENDTFDLMVGAQIAFDKLTGRYVKPQKEPNPAPQPAHRFKVGDRVVTSIGHGKIVEVDPEAEEGKPYRIKYDNGFCYWKNSAEAKPELKPAPAPEPPKFYTGKVVCISGEYGVGRIFTVKDGFFADRQYNCPEKPYKSVDDMNNRFLFGKFAEAKE